MIRRIFTLLLAGAACLVPATLSAQEKTAARVTLRLLAFSNDQKVEEAFIHDPAAPPDTTPFTAGIKSYLNHQSVTVTSFSQKLVITRDADRSSMTSKGPLIAEVTLPRNARSVLLLFLPGKTDDKASSQVMAIDDSIGAFPPGSYLVTNLSPHPVRIQLEKKVFSFKPGQRSLIEDPPVRANNHSGMRSFAQVNNEWLPIGTGLWPHPGKARSLLVLYPNPETGMVNLRAFGDTPPRKPTADQP